MIKKTGPLSALCLHHMITLLLYTRNTIPTEHDYGSSLLVIPRRVLCPGWVCTTLYNIGGGVVHASGSYRPTPWVCASI